MGEMDIVNLLLNWRMGVMRRTQWLTIRDPFKRGHSQKGGDMNTKYRMRINLYLDGRCRRGDSQSLIRFHTNLFLNRKIENMSRLYNLLINITNPRTKSHFSISLLLNHRREINSLLRMNITSPHKIKTAINLSYLMKTTPPPRDYQEETANPPRNHHRVNMSLLRLLFLILNNVIRRHPANSKSNESPYTHTKVLPR